MTRCAVQRAGDMRCYPVLTQGSKRVCPRPAGEWAQRLCVCPPPGAGVQGLRGGPPSDAHTLRGTRLHTPLVLVAQSRPILCDPWTVALQALLSGGCSRRECWSGLPFPFPGDLPNTGIKPGSSALQADSLPTKPPLLVTI